MCESIANADNHRTKSVFRVREMERTQTFERCARFVPDATGLFCCYFPAPFGRMGSICTLCVRKQPVPAAPRSVMVHAASNFHGFPLNHRVAASGAIHAFSHCRSNILILSSFCRPSNEQPWPSHAQANDVPRAAWYHLRRIPSCFRPDLPERGSPGAHR